MSVMNPLASSTVMSAPPCEVSRRLPSTSVDAVTPLTLPALITDTTPEICVWAEKSRVFPLINTAFALAMFATAVVTLTSVFAEAVTPV